MADSGSKIPEKNTSQWVKNEKTINTIGALKQARDISEGIDKPASKYKQTHGGKGSHYRPVDKAKFDANWDAIFNKNNAHTGNTDDNADTKDNL